MATSSSDTAFLTIEKSIARETGREHYANVYHFDQVPPNTTAWDNLASQVQQKEALFCSANTMWEKYYGHIPGTPPVLVYEQDLPPAGEGGLGGTYLPGAGFHHAPPDAAMWIRYGTTQKSKLGKPIYLRNYYHDVFVNDAGTLVDVGQVTAMGTLGAAMVAGFTYNGITYRRAGPRGAVAQNHQQSTYPTTRTLKRRGRRRKALPAGTTIQYPPLIVPGELNIN